MNQIDKCSKRNSLLIYLQNYNILIINECQLNI